MAKGGASIIWYIEHPACAQSTWAAKGGRGVAIKIRSRIEERIESEGGEQVKALLTNQAQAHSPSFLPFSFHKHVQETMVV